MSKRKRKQYAREGCVPLNALSSAIAPYPRVFTLQELLQDSSYLLPREVDEALPEAIRDAVLAWLDSGCVGEPPIDRAELARIIGEHIAKQFAPAEQPALCAESVRMHSNLSSLHGITSKGTP